jgi:hypothetical protein
VHGYTVAILETEVLHLSLSAGFAEVLSLA